MDVPNSNNNNATLQHGTADAAGDNGSSTQQRSRSGRTIRKPAAFAPTSQPASRNAGRGKRKRDVHAEEEDEENASNDDGNQEEADEHDESLTEASEEAASDVDDFGRRAVGRRAAAKNAKNASGGKRNNAKKAKTTTGTSTLPLRTAARKPPTKARKPTAAQTAPVGDGELFGMRAPSKTRIRSLRRPSFTYLLGEI
jgi:hypothetical protein